MVVKELVNAVEKVILTVNYDKTKYLIISRRNINYRHVNNILNLKDVHT